MIVASDVREKLEQILAELDEHLFVVSVEVKGANTIFISFDHDNDPIGIDTVVSVTRAIESEFDREVEDYELEVTSAGLTTPLILPRQYAKYLGKELEVLMTTGVKEEGVLERCDEEGIDLNVTRMLKKEGDRRKKPYSELLHISYGEIKRASYLLRF